MTNETSKPNRREFMADSGKVAAGMIAAGAFATEALKSTASAASYGKIIGANDTINMAIAGIRSRGSNHIDSFSGMKNVKIKALCDVDENVLNNRAANLEKKKGYKPETYWDFREMLKDKDIDAVSLATPNFWHALGTVWACQAGKHVYVEKPCCHNVFEGRKMVEAARKYKCLVQVGFQNRSIKNVRAAMKFLQDGGIGDVYMARGLCYKSRMSIGKPKDGIGTGPEYDYFAFNRPGEKYTQEYMDKVHYNDWIGPARVRPFNYNRFHYNWHWQWEYGSGDIGNQGPHQWDVARWGLGANEHPVKVSSMGGFFVWKDSAQETPNTQSATVEYADGRVIEFEVRGVYTNPEEGITVGNFFYGTKGWMHLDGSKWSTYFGYKNEPGPTSSESGEFADPNDPAGAGGGGHFENFIAALRNNDINNLSCDIEEGYLSSALPLLANASYRLGRTLYFDGKKEKFIKDPEADKLITREYRKPYVVPESV